MNCYYITVKDFKDKEFTGVWNGKYYDSNKPKGKYEFSLYRIYIDNTEVHIKKEQKEELEQLKAKLDVPEKVEKSRAYVIEALKQATDEELKQEMLRRNLIKSDPIPTKENKNTILPNRFERLELK